MKFRFLALLALVLGLASCQKDTYGLEVDSKGEAAVTLNVALPDDATRAAGTDSAKGGVNNVDLTNTYDIRFILEVYNADGTLAKERMTEVKDTETSASFSFRLIPGRNYKFVVWADFVDQGSDGKVDLHYNTDATGLGLRNVTVVTNDWKVIDESRDAYTGFKVVENFSSLSALTEPITLTRPFAKLRVVTNDIKEMISVRPAVVKVNYFNTKFYNTFDAFSAEAKNLVDAPANLTTILADDTYTGEKPEETGVQTLFADYFFGAENDRVMFYFDVQDNGGIDLPQVTFNTNIPVQRNYLTTIYGPVLTDSNNITVTIKDAFDGYINVGGNVVTTDAELLAALNQDVENISIVLGADLSLDVNSSRTYNIGGPKTKTITISGIDEETRATEPYTLTFNLTDEDWSNVITDATLVLKDLNIETSGYNTGHWKRDHLNFNCDVELYNVTSTPIELGGNSVVKNLTINNAYTDTYALWIGTLGQVINIDGLVVNSAEDDNRGIKIADEDREAKSVTLNIKNAVFKTAKKAAILATTNYGATINVGENVDITNVAADSNFAVWVDEDRAGTFDDIVVNGALKKVEGSKDAVAADDTTVDEAIAAGATTVYLTEGTFIIPDSAQGKEVTFIGSGDPKDTVIATQDDGSYEGCDYSLDGSTVVFENISINTDSSTYTGYARCKGTYKNCIINGTYTLYGDSVFEDCTFNVSGDVYNIWTWGAKNISFERCTFNSDGKALLLYQEGTNTINLNVATCTFNDNGALADLKAAIEIGDAPYGATPTYYVNVSDTKVNGYEINDNGIYTGTTLWANKNSMPAERLIVTVDGYTWVADGLSKKDGKYYVSNANGLVYMAKSTLKGGEGVKLAANIDLAGVEFAGLNAFNPENNNTFDGQDFTVSNWTYEGGASEMGFIRNWVGPIKNIKFENCHVKSAGRSAIVAAKAYGAIENVTVNNCTIEDSYWACGIIAGLYNAGSIKNCTVTNSSIKSNGGTGGIVGVINESAGERVIEGCSVSNTTINNTGVYGASYSGGALVGMFNADGATYRIKACTVSNNELLGNHVFEKYPADENVTEE